MKIIIIALTVASLVILGCADKTEYRDLSTLIVQGGEPILWMTKDFHDAPEMPGFDFGFIFTKEGTAQRWLVGDDTKDILYSNGVYSNPQPGEWTIVIPDGVESQTYKLRRIEKGGDDSTIIVEMTTIDRSDKTTVTVHFRQVIPSIYSDYKRRQEK